jgi:hypothetical protein
LAQLDLTNVERAFAEIGVDIKDANGEYLTLYDVIEEAASKQGYLTEEAIEDISGLSKEVFE